MVGALLDMPTTVYMGRKDMKRQEMNVFRMRLLGAEVEEITRGNEGLAEAVDAAMEDLIENTDETHYLVGSAVGPEHAALQELGRAEYHAITDDEALAAFRELSETEGIIPALEPSHVIALALKFAEEDRHDTTLINLCGRGDKDMQTATEKFDLH